MRKKIFSGGIALALSASLCTAPLPVDAAITPGNTYTDTAKHWSLQVVEKASALDLLKGYPGNLFKPEDSVSRLEAVAIIIRAMGLEDEAQKVDAAKSGITLPRGMTWGQGHLVIAVQKGLLSKNYVPILKYRDAITRQEVATLVAVALINDKKISNGDPSKLTFSDNSKTLDLYKPYVAAVTENNIMTGIGDNKFGPELVMKRGQMAALMAKLAQDGWFAYGADRLVAGTAVSVNSTSGLLTIRKSDGATIYKVMNSKPALFKDGKAASLDQITAGTPVIVAINQTGMVQYIEITKEPPAESITPDLTVSGRVVYSPRSGDPYIKIAAGSNRQINYPVSGRVQVKDDLGVRDISAITDGKYVTVKIKENEVYHVQILSTVSTQGRIYSVDTGALRIEKEDGQIVTYTLQPAETLVTGGSGSLSAYDLSTGNLVKVVSFENRALEVIVTETAISGTIRNVDTPYRAIAIVDNNNNRLVYEVDRYAVITSNGRSILLENLQQGDKVKLTLGSAGKVTKLEVEKSTQYVEGRVADLRLGSSLRIGVEAVNGNIERYYFSNRTDITKNNSLLDPEDIIIGAQVRLITDNDGNVTDIEIINDTNITVEGEVVSTVPQYNYITILQTSGAQFRLNIDQNCIFRDQVSANSGVDQLSEIANGWYVKLTLGGGNVTYLLVTEK